MAEKHSLRLLNDTPRFILRLGERSGKVLEFVDRGPCVITGLQEGEGHSPSTKEAEGGAH